MIISLLCIVICVAGVSINDISNAVFIFLKLNNVMRQIITKNFFVTIVAIPV